MMMTSIDFQGTAVWKGLLDRASQEAIVADLREIARKAPFQRFETPGGHKMSVQMSGAGEVAWTADRSGYAYVPTQPRGGAWPEIPVRLLSVWKTVTEVSRMPDSCLINYYGESARMGLHQDRDEKELKWPVVSISLGDDAQFRVGGLARRDPTRSIWLKSGDVVVLSGRSRLAHHGIDQIRFGSSSLLSRGGRINVTLRVAT